MFKALSALTGESYYPVFAFHITYIYINMYLYFHILHAPLENKIKQNISFLLLQIELKLSLIIDHSEKSISGKE